MPGESGRANEAVPTERQDPGCLDPRGWWRALNLRSCCHPRTPPLPQLPPSPLPRCRGSLEGCRRKAIRPPAGRGRLPGPGQGIAPCWGRKRDPRFPRPRQQSPARAGGGAGAGRGLWPQAGQGSAWRCGRGDGPCHGSGAGGSDSDLAPPVRAGSGNATRVSPARARRFHKDRCRPHQRQASARPGGREAPARGGAGAGRGLWPPAGPDPGAALWQGRWPLPWQR